MCKVKEESNFRHMAALYKCESWEEEKETAIVYKTVVCHHCAHLLKGPDALKLGIAHLKH